MHATPIQASFLRPCCTSQAGHMGKVQASLCVLPPPAPLPMLREKGMEQGPGWVI